MKESHENLEVEVEVVVAVVEVTETTVKMLLATLASYGTYAQ
jgi:hypothetical protein